MPLATALPLLLSLTATARAADALPATPIIQAAALSDGQKGDGKNGGGGGGNKKGKKGKREKEPGRKIAAAEFPNSARTLKQGAIVLSPLIQPSSYGISNKVQLLVPIVPQMLGPQLAVRYDFKNTKKADLAIEPFVSSNWSLSGVTAGANLRYTMAVNGGRLNLGAGAGFSTTLDTVESVAEGGTSGLDTTDIPTSGLTSTNVEVGYDMVVDDKTVWRFVGAVDPYLTSQGASSGMAAVNWNHSFNESFRLGLGLGAYAGGSTAQSILSEAGIDMKSRKVTPLPTVELWWRL